MITMKFKHVNETPDFTFAHLSLIFPKSDYIALINNFINFDNSNMSINIDGYKFNLIELSKRLEVFFKSVDKITHQKHFDESLINYCNRYDINVTLPILTTTGTYTILEEFKKYLDELNLRLKFFTVECKLTTELIVNLILDIANFVKFCKLNIALTTL